MKRIFLTSLLISLIGLLNLTAQERIYTPELSLPANSAIDQMPDVVLDWNGVTGGNTGIINYDVQMDIDPGFPNPVNFETEFLTAVQTENLLFGETYYWHVRARDGSTTSDWSETRSFRVILRVNLADPADASVENDTVRIGWSNMTGITEYDIQFDTVYYWEPMASGQTVALAGLYVVDESHAWIVGKSGLVMFYDGSSWVEQESNLNKDLTSVYFLDANNGWAVSKGGKIIYYNGTSWTEQNSGTANDLNGVHMLDASNGWAVGKDDAPGTTPDTGFVMHYNGSEWTRQFNASQELYKVFAVDPTHVWAVGKGGVILFYNGTTWTEQQSGTIKDLAGVAFASANQGWVVGKTGLILQYDNGVWKTYNKNLTTKDLNAIFFTDANNAWIVGKGGTGGGVILQFDGMEWFNQSGTSTSNYNAVGLSGAAGFIAGDNGSLLRFTNETFTSPMATISHIPGDQLSKKYIDLLFGTQYFWRMRAKHNQDISEWSGARSFITLSTVTLDKPTNNDDEQYLDLLLRWKNQMSEMVSYEIQVDDDPAYGSPVFLATTNFEINAELLKFGVEYNWRVRAMHALDISDWSTSWKFTTINTVVLESPANNETDVKLSPLLTWEAHTGIIEYQVQVAGNNSFSAPIASEFVPVEESSYIVPVVLDKDVQYYWRVRAINGLDTSGWSNTWSFRTTPPVGVDEFGLAGKLNIYPNPAENTVYLQLKEKYDFTLSLTITDLMGKTVVKKDIRFDTGNTNIPVDVSALQNGIYMLKVADNENTFTKKLIIKR